MSRAVLVGILFFVALGGLVVATIVLTEWTPGGYAFTVEFQDVRGLARESAVFYKGFKVGKVKGITWDIETGNLLVAVRIFQDLEIPSNVSFVVRDSTLFGGKQLTILDPPTDSGQYIEPGAKLDLVGESKGTVQAIAEAEYADKLAQVGGDLERFRNALLGKFWRAHLDLLVVNHMRLELKDAPADSANDWFQPLVKAMFAYAEYYHRLQAHLPQVLDSMDAVYESLFLNMVTQGYQSPLESWQALKAQRGVEAGAISETEQ